MKQKYKMIGLVSVLLATLSIISVSAETYYEYYGYTYTIFNNTSVSLAGWDNRTPELTVPDSLDGRYVISVANNGLRDNTEITSVDFSQATRLKRIGMSAFYGCTGLSQTVVLPESLEVMNDGAFQGCTALPGVVMNSGLTNIPDQCFFNCTALKEVRLNEGLQSIQRIAFAHCTSLEYVEIPKSVESIAATAFYGDTNLTLGVWYGSYGYTYAKSKNIPYVLLEGVKLGDTNGDGYVYINDVTAIQRHVAELEYLEGIYQYAADINRDGVIDITDATELQRFLAEFEVAYPIDELITQ